jgi:hypothetical protein
MASTKKTVDLELPGATLFGKANIRAEVKDIRERHDRMLADDVKYSGDTIDHVIVPSRQATEIAWTLAVKARDDIRAQSSLAFGLVCLSGVLLTTIFTAALMPGDIDPVILVAFCTAAVCLSSAFFATAYDYICRGGHLSPISGVFSNPVTGFYPWMRDRVLMASHGAWGIGGKGVYVPRFPRDDYEPYHNIIPYETITSVEVSNGAGLKGRPYSAHLIVRVTNRAAAYEFDDASTADGLSARELADILDARVRWSKRTASPPG